MPTVAEKMKAYTAKQQQKETNPEEHLVKYRKMPLAEVGKLKIQFGKVMINKTFEEAFNDHKWTDFFTQRYHRSNKMEHRLYLEYVERRLDADLPNEMVENANPPPTSKNQSPRSSEWSQIEEMMMASQVEPPSQSGLEDVEERVLNLQESNHHLNNRMASMESTMHEVLRAVQALSVKTEP